MKRMLERVTSWSQYYKLMENDQAAVATQPTAQQTTPQQATAQATPAAATNAQATPQPQQAAQAQPAANTPNQAQPTQNSANQQQPVTQGNTPAPAANTQATPQQANPTTPQSQIVAQNGQGQVAQESLNATSWASFNRINESLAMPGGCLDIEATEYEKNLDKRNKARNNPKIIGNIGDKDAGEIGVHDYDKETGIPTGKLNTILKPRKSSKLILQGAK